jgi:putative phosphoribosyl transferase
MRAVQQFEVAITEGGISLDGTLSLPDDCLGVVAFAHGSGSSRHSSRNRAVARHLQSRGCATLLLDLLTESESQDRRNVFDIDLLAQRMAGAARWLGHRAETAPLPMGFFGASTGAAAAIVAAASLDHPIAAIVSRGGRPDLAGEARHHLLTPTLLIVGSLDTHVLELNREAQRQMHCPTRLDVIDGATHLFEEPGTLEQVADLAGQWFVEHFTQAPRAA